ncbi:OCIA domain-containing protein 1 [Prorops nasuta]|uniref:OCIA domain-containing protein 1 n=1 Tax=Prorops nasuta TaxID=863751 RepID=UPI0034CE05FA
MSGICDKSPYQSNRPLSYQPPNIQLTEYEKQVFEDCMKKEAFYNSSLPGAIVFAAIGYAAYRYVPSKNPVGKVITVASSGILGYLACKIHYAYNVCFPRLMNLPNSTIKYQIERLQKGFTEGNIHPHAESNDDAELINNEQTQEVDSSIDVSSDMSGSFEYPVKEELDLSNLADARSGILTYDELRKKNREDYLKKQQSDYKDFSSKLYNRRKNIDEQVPETGTENITKPKNKYGDIWE